MKRLFQIDRRHPRTSGDPPIHLMKRSIQAMHNDLIEHDIKQRRQALDPAQSFIVQAPAGSGKTELLIQRFLVLLNQVNAPEEILAITFTKKSANEMRARVIKALKFALSHPEPESAHEKQTWQLAKQALRRDQEKKWNLIDNPNQLRIQTIDSLCTNLTRQLPLLSHFGSQPDISDNADMLYREAVHEVLSHVEEKFEWSQAIAELLLHLDNDLNKLHDLLVNLLAKRDQWLPYIHLDTNDADIKVTLEHQLAAVINEKLSAVNVLLPVNIVNDLLEISRFAASNLSLLDEKSDVYACLDLTSLPKPTAANKTAWLGLARLLLTKSFSWRKRPDAEIGFPTLKSIKNPSELQTHHDYRDRLTAIVTTLSENEPLRLALTELFHLPNLQYQDNQWDALQSLLHVLKIVAAQLRVTFQQHGQIDFIENAQAARTALGDNDSPTDLALAMDYQIRHILVDEFQDTAFTQNQLLEKLITGWEQHDGRTLFVVGDPMQSIYRFREAEVGLFIRMRNHGIGHITLTPLTLSINFRSTPIIVDWNNQQFHHIFPSFNDIATGAVTYSHSVSFKSDGDYSRSHVTVQGFLDAEDNIQGKHIAKIIHETKKNYPKDNIAILVRSRSHLADIIPVLKQERIAYQAVDIDPLASRQHISDLLSLTCALLHPADKISWLAILRAPWCGLSLADLLVISGSQPHATIWEQLENKTITQQLSDDGKQRLNRIFPILKSKIAERDRTDFRNWIESTWLLLGGPACLHDHADIDDANAFFALLDNLSQQNQFVQLDLLKEKIEKLYAPGQHDDTSVQIMTIHTAKGLEFDTVILPHLERKMPSDDKSLLLWMELPLENDQNALLLAPIHATGTDADATYVYIQRQRKIKSDYETDRLFYVAATRAKKRSYMLFNTSQNDKGEYKTESGSFLEKLWPCIDNQKHLIIQNHVTSHDEIPEAKETHRYISRLATEWVNPVSDTLTTKIASHLNQNGFQLVDQKPRLAGVAIHRVLQLISQHGMSWWTDNNAGEQMSYLKRQLSQLGVLPAELPAVTKMTHVALQKALSDPRGQWILQSHTDAKSEFAITAAVDGAVEKFVLDRTFVDEAGVRWIIDYKTAALLHSDLEHFLEKEQGKYLEKMQKYCEAMKLIDSRPIRLGLYFPALPAWREWEPG